jgi:hypothetical protein
MKDIDIVRIIDIPPATLTRWKKAGDFRKILYTIVKSMSKEELKQYIQNKDNSNE